MKRHLARVLLGLAITAFFLGHVAGVYNVGFIDQLDSIIYDARLRLTYRLGAGWLRLEAEVHNPDTVELPFGLGYHPYFRVPFHAGISLDTCEAQVPARHFWQLDHCLPTGERPHVDGARDLNLSRRLVDLALDDVYTDLPPAPLDGTGLQLRGTLRGAPGQTLLPATMTSTALRRAIPAEKACRSFMTPLGRQPLTGAWPRFGRVAIWCSLASRAARSHQLTRRCSTPGARSISPGRPLGTTPPIGRSCSGAQATCSPSWPTGG